MARVASIGFFYGLFLGALHLGDAAAYGRPPNSNTEKTAACRTKVSAIKSRPTNFSFGQTFINLPSNLVPDDDTRIAIQSALTKLESRLRSRMARSELNQVEQEWAQSSLNPHVADLVSKYLQQKSLKKEMIDADGLVHAVYARVPLSDAEWQHVMPQTLHDLFEGKKSIIASDLVAHGLSLVEDEKELTAILLENSAIIRAMVSDYDSTASSRRNLPLTRRLTRMIEAYKIQHQSKPRPSAREKLIESIVGDWEASSDRKSFHRILAEALVGEIEIRYPDQSLEKAYQELKPKALHLVTMIDIAHERTPVTIRDISRIKQHFIGQLFGISQPKEKPKAAAKDLLSTYRSLLLGEHNLAHREKQEILTALLSPLSQFVEQALDAMHFTKPKDRVRARNNLLKRLGTKSSDGPSPIDRVINEEFERFNGRAIIYSENDPRLDQMINSLKFQMSLNDRLYFTQRIGFDTLFERATPQSFIILDQLLAGASGLSNALKKRAWASAQNEADFERIYAEQIGLAVKVLESELKDPPEMWSFEYLRNLRKTVLKAVKAPEVIQPPKTEAAPMPKPLELVSTDGIEENIVAAFMKQNRVLPIFTAAEESEFFESLLKLESQIIALAQGLGRASGTQSEIRVNRVRQIILPLVGEIKELEANRETKELAALLRLWLDRRDEVIRRNLGLIIRFVTRKAPPRNWEVQFVDQLKTLNNAFDTFEPSRGYKFSTFAVSAIKKGIARSEQDLNRSQFMSPESQKLIYKFRLLEDKARRETGHGPTLEEVAQKLGISLERAEQITELSAVRNVGLHSDGGREKGSRNSELIPAPKKPDFRDDSLIKGKKRLILSLARFLTDEGLRFVLEQDLEGKTMREIGAGLGLTFQAIQLRLKRATLALRAVIGIESERIVDARDVDLLAAYFGLYGTPNTKMQKLKDRFQMSADEIEEKVNSLLEQVTDEDFESLLLSEQ